MKPASPRWRSHAQRSRRIKLVVLPDGKLYGSVVEVTSRRPYREKTVAWLGRTPTVEQMRRACRIHGAHFPRSMKSISSGGSSRVQQ